MRKKILLLSANAGMAMFLIVFMVYFDEFAVSFATEENDFFDDGDDGVVESLQEEHFSGSEQADYESPRYDPKQFHFVETFDDVRESEKRWVKSQAIKDDVADDTNKYDGKWKWEPPQRIVSKRDIGLVLKSKAKHHAIATKLSKVFTFKEDKPLVVQYEVNMQEGQDCGGSYLKLLSAGKHLDDLSKFNDKTPYTIMFGPDKCGSDQRMHFIFRHVNPINGNISEQHAPRPKERIDDPFKDKLPHLFRLVVRPDNTFEIRIDHKVINQGSLLNDFHPGVNPPREIDDPNDEKPKDWDEREKIPDESAQKPEDWDEDAPPQIPDPTAEKPEGWLEDEPEMIPDPTAQKPEDWDAEMDGEWEAPLVDNPICEGAVGCGKWKAPLIPNKEYKGKWRAPMIDNPNYRGKWAPKKILNPGFFEDLTPFRMTPIGAIGLELWSMSNEILFDNMIVTDSLEAAIDFAAKTFDVKRKYIDKESDTFFNMVSKFSKENPWPFRIGVVVVATLFAFSFYSLCMKTGGKKAKDQNDDAKKTDALQEDDVSSSAAAAAGRGDADETSNATRDGSIPKGEKTSPKQKKSDLDVADDQSEEQQQESEGEATGEGAAEETEESTSKPRKRRVRKDQA